MSGEPSTTVFVRKSTTMWDGWSSTMICIHPSLPSSICKNLCKGWRTVIWKCLLCTGNHKGLVYGLSSIHTESAPSLTVPSMTKSMLSPTTGMKVCACPAIATMASSVVMISFLFIIFSFLSLQSYVYYLVRTRKRRKNRKRGCYSIFDAKILKMNKVNNKRWRIKCQTVTLGLREWLPKRWKNDNNCM